MKLENQWAEATVKGDVQTLDRLYADEYLSIDGAGATFTKTQDIANVKSGNFKLTAYKLDELKVRVHGEIAVVTGRNTVTATYMGKDVSGAYRFTDVFVNRAGRWQVLTTQETLVTGKMKVLSGTAPETVLFRADAAAGGGDPLAGLAWTATRAAGDPAAGARLREASSVVLAKAGGAGDCTLDLSVKLKFPKILKRKAVLPPEGGIAGAAPAVVRQEQSPRITLDGVFLQGDPSPVLLPVAPGETDPASGVALSPGAILDLAVAADAAYGSRDLLYVPPPLLGEPFRFPGAFVVPSEVTS